MSMKCAHPPCVCSIDPERLAQGAKFCADLCATEPEGEACPCGHEGCTRAMAEDPGGESVTTVGEQYDRGGEPIS